MYIYGGTAIATSATPAADTANNNNNNNASKQYLNDLVIWDCETHQFVRRHHSGDVPPALSGHTAVLSTREKCMVIYGGAIVNNSSSSSTQSTLLSNAIYKLYFVENNKLKWLKVNNIGALPVVNFAAEKTTSNEKWREKGRQGHTAVMNSPHTMLIAGGWQESQGPVSTAFEYHLETSTLAPVHFETHGSSVETGQLLERFGATLVQDTSSHNLYLIGGRNSKFEGFDGKQSTLALVKRR